MTTFELPLTVRTPDGRTDLLVTVPGRATWRDSVEAIVAAAHLPTGQELHLGPGPVEADWLLGHPPLLAGAVLSTAPDDGGAVAAAVLLCAQGGPDAGHEVPLGAEPVIVGRDPAASLTVDDPELSWRHARVESTARGLRVVDLDSMNGVGIDGRPAAGSDSLVGIGCLIRLGGTLLRTELSLEPAAVLTPDGVGHLALTRPATMTRAWRPALPPDPGHPPERSRRPLPLLAAGLGAIAGCALAVLTGNWAFLAFAGLGPLTMIATAVGDRAAGRAPHRRATAGYRLATAARAAGLTAVATADRSDSWDRFPGPASVLRRARRPTVRLWERRPDGADFLVLDVGTGERPTRIGPGPEIEPVPPGRPTAQELPTAQQMPTAQHGPTMQEEPTMQAPPVVPMVAEVPITVDLRRIGVLGLTGSCRPLLRWLISQLAGLHSPADVRLMVCSSNADLSPASALPHTSAAGEVGELITDSDGAKVVLAGLAVKSGGIRETVLILDDAQRWCTVPGMTALLAGAAIGASGVHAVCVATTASELPGACTAIATVTGSTVRIQRPAGTRTAHATGVGSNYFEQLARALAPLTDPANPGGSLPHRVRLSELTGGMRVADLRRRWSQPSAQAVIGMAGAGPLTLDLDADGPHLLIAGTTGSGKSELLLTLIAALAGAAPPTATTFLLVDYKGGAAFTAAAALPHTVGVVTDLDPALAARALASLRAEVRRREEMLAAAGAADMVAQRRIDPRNTAPRLVIVVDEFAAMAAELPAFLSGLVEIAQRGRSLGMHLVLATQRPSGVVSPAIKANMAARICLRVTDDAESLDVVDTAAAAGLPRGCPGRAVLRTGRAELTVFQAASVTVPADSNLRVRVRVRQQPESGRDGETSDAPSEFVALVAAAREAAADLPPPSPPWLPPLPSRFIPQGCHGEDAIALVDRPGRQLQEPLRPPAGSVLVTGPPGSGRSTALRRIAWAASVQGTELLLIDAGGALADVGRWPATSTALGLADPALVQRLTRRLTATTVERRPGEGRPLLLVVDGWDAVADALEPLDYGATVAALADIAGRGPASAIRVAAAGQPRLLHHRSAQGFTTVIALGSPEDGTSRLGGQLPPGRGSCGPDEIQIAWQAPQEIPPIPQRRAKWPDRLVVRALPDLVRAADLPIPVPAAVPWGLGGDDGGVRSVDLTGPPGALLVAGPRRSGVSTAIGTLTRGAAAAGLPVLRCLLRPHAATDGVIDIDLRAGAEPLRSALAAHDGPLLLVVDDGHELEEHPAAESVSRFVNVAQTGQQLLLGCRLDRALRANRGPIREAAQLRRGLLLQADTPEGLLLEAVLPRRRGTPIPGRGYLIEDGAATPIQVAR